MRNTYIKAGMISADLLVFIKRATGSTIIYTITQIVWIDTDLETINIFPKLSKLYSTG